MKDKTVVITGATSGIGEAAALALAQMGARVAFVARDAKRADQLLAKLRAANPKAAPKAYIADISTLAEMKRIGGEIAAAEPQIHALANNAGAIFQTRQETADGLERTFAVNHMAYFVLTHGLLDRLKATPGARIVSTASGAHRMGGALDFDDLQLKRSYAMWAAYGRSKLANILFTRALGRRLEGSGVTANCFHPGFVASNFATNNGVLAKGAMFMAKAVALSPEKGADTLVWLAASDAVARENGGYFDRRQRGDLAPFARDDAAAERLWDVSREIAGLP
jgi:NAD(P)-dependent dehydrogenase (short-subunit alcohol dehydrogenase family)